MAGSFNIKDLQRALTPRILHEFVPHTPFAQQAAFLVYDGKEALYGGSAGSGKSDCLLMSGLMYVDFPGYNAVIIRKTFADLSKPEGLIPRAHEWLGGTSAIWKEQLHQWRFPSGATLSFGHFEDERAKYNYQGAAYQTVIFDELTQFTENQYEYLFSRLRRLEGVPIPTRMRSASNPGGTGHEWVKRRFVTRATATAPFFAARMADNKHLDAKDYLENMEFMRSDTLTRKQLVDGDWNASAKGPWSRDWFDVVRAWPLHGRSNRSWDFAATEDGGDYTAGARWVRGKEGLYLIDMQREQFSPNGVKKLVRDTAQADGHAVKIILEQQPGAAGISMFQDYKNDQVLSKYLVKGYRPTGPKLSRWKILADYAEEKGVKVLAAPWNEAFFQEWELLNTVESEHDDQADAASMGFIKLIEDKGDDWQIL